MDINLLKTVADLKYVDRIIKSQEELNISKNRSFYSIKNLKLQSGEYKTRNFSFCDFENADIKGCIFWRCNFSFSVNLNKAITDDKTEFKECNLSGADLPQLNVSDSNTYRFIDNEIEEMFKERK